MAKQARSERPRARGARSRQTGVARRADAWLAHHRFSARDALARLLYEPLRNAITLAMLGVALALPALLYVALSNLGQLSGSWSGAQQISLYLQPGAREAAVQPLVQQLQQRPDLAAVTPVSPDQGLAEFAAATGLTGLTADLHQNPLPWVLIVTPVASDLASLQPLRDELAALPLVEDARLDLAWLERLARLMALGQRLALGLGSLLGLGMLLAIGNTLRLAIEARREEIRVIKLVGGTDAFVRRPFLYTGVWYGLGGGLVALLLVWLGLWAVSGPVTQLVTSYQSDFALQGLGPVGSLSLLCTALIIGWAGAWLAVGRHLRDIQPG